MEKKIVSPNVKLPMRLSLMRMFPCFASFTTNESEALASLMEEVHYGTQQIIVRENELVDSVYIIVQGEAEVTRNVMQGKKIIPVPLAVLRTGESIGLNDTGFYSATGKRTATVTAITDMLLLRLDLKILNEFLRINNLELSMYAASRQMLRMNFIKQSLPFAKISHERLQWLAEHVEDLSIPKGTIIFSQGERGDKCYLIYSGKVEIISTQEGEERCLALLKPPVLFGEATLITHSARNATARALEDCELLVLRHEHLSELIESEDDVSHMLMNLMVDRSRPLKNLNVSLHHRKTADNQEMIILKNPDNGNYFKLSVEGAFVWQQLDGKHTMQDITLALAEQHKVFAPDIVAALISKLSKAGFIDNIDLPSQAPASGQPIWVRAMKKMKQILEWRVTLGDADKWITQLYQRCFHYLFSKLGQIFLALLAGLGLIAFIISTPNILLFFSFKHASLLVILTLIPLSMVEAILHELGHALAVKAFGREVHYMGVGWYWFGPIAFTDTSDIWLSERKARILVNLAGVYVDILVAGIVALFIFFIENPYVQSMLWLFALYTYIGGIRMLSPLQEMDGYYVLSDWLEKNGLRRAAVLWLVRDFPQALRHPSLFRKHWREVSYWLMCLLYLVVVTILTYLLQTFVLTIFDIKPHTYFSFILPFLVLVVSSFTVIADIRQQAEE